MQRYPNQGSGDFKVLGESLTLPFSGLKAQSRLLKAAMTERLSSWDQTDLSKRGTPSQTLINVYEEWGKGGFGIVLTGNAMVDPIQLEAPGNPVIYGPDMTKERIEAFRKQAEAAKRHGSLCIMQVSHPGRQVAESINPHPISASDVKLDDRMGMSFAKPHAASQEEIDGIVEAFATTAYYAHQTGYDGVQLHGAHGYLLAQFLASSTNKRTDKYGGSLTNRARIVFEIIDAIRKRVPDPKFSIGMKLNSVEFQEGGFQPEEAKELCAELEKKQLDWVELSGGTYEKLAFGHTRESTKAREAFFLEFADIIRPALKKTLVFVTGGWRTSKAMADAIKGGSTDGIGLARPVCAEPHLPKLVIDGKVDGAIKPVFDDADFALGNVVAGTQIAQIGRGQKPFDSSDQKQVQQFKQELQGYMSKMQTDIKNGIVKAGYPVWSYNPEVAQQA